MFVGILAICMALAAFIALAGQGTSGPRPDFAMTLRTGAVFGAV
ncbi:hypothetical protein [Mangrovicoccus sp. HB161399]|nr:hypothetical protein [Mangrovicoccus sp. HB161399]